MSILERTFQFGGKDVFDLHLKSYLNNYFIHSSILSYEIVDIAEINKEKLYNKRGYYDLQYCNSLLNETAKIVLEKTDKILFFPSYMLDEKGRVIKDELKALEKTGEDLYNQRLTHGNAIKDKHLTYTLDRVHRLALLNKPEYYLNICKTSKSELEARIENEKMASDYVDVYSEIHSHVHVESWGSRPGFIGGINNEGKIMYSILEYTKAIIL